MHDDTPLQVAGHRDIIYGSVRSTLMKRVRGFELQNYHEMYTCRSSILCHLPQFFGIMDSEGEFHAVGSSRYADLVNSRDSWICLENLLFEFKNPCVLDVKIGKIRHNRSMDVEKISRSLKKCGESSSSTLGLYICGASHNPQVRVQCNKKLQKFEFARTLESCFDFSDGQISTVSRTALFDHIITRLSCIREDLKSIVNTFSFISTSILICYDVHQLGKHQSGEPLGPFVSLKIIDLSNCTQVHPHGYDDSVVGFIAGLSNLISSFQIILQEQKNSR